MFCLHWHRILRSLHDIDETLLAKLNAKIKTKVKKCILSFFRVNQDLACESDTCMIVCQFWTIRLEISMETESVLKYHSIDI